MRQENAGQNENDDPKRQPDQHAFDLGHAKILFLGVK
jgi:hypothetical protein